MPRIQDDDRMLKAKNTYDGDEEPDVCLCETIADEVVLAFQHTL